MNHKFFSNFLLVFGQLMHALMENVDNVYKYPNFRGRAKICKTNLPPGVPMRAAGTASGMVIQETILSHVAVTLGIPEEKVTSQSFLYYLHLQKKYLEIVLPFFML